MRIRLEFAKGGAARFASHRDVARMFQRCFAACDIPVAYSRGYHPHMKLSFGPPPKTGWESEAEYLDVWVESTEGSFVDRVNRVLPQGVRVRQAVEMNEATGKLGATLSACRLAVRVHSGELPGATEVESDSLAERAADLDFVSGTAAGANGKPPEISGVTIHHADDDTRVEYTSTMPGGRVFAPDTVVRAMGVEPGDLRVSARVSRLAQFVGVPGSYRSPLCEGAVRELL